MKKASLSLSVTLLAAVLGLSVACSRKPNDAKISADIQSKLSQDSGLSSKQLIVQSSDGVVTLSGSVDNAAQRDAAAQQAASVEGVKEVVNNLQVGLAPTAPAPVQPTQMANATPPAVKTDKPKPGRESKHVSHVAESTTNDQPDGSTAAPQNSEPPVAENAQPANTSAPIPVPPPQPPPAPKPVSIDQGTQLTVRLVDGIDSEKNQTGQTFHATLNAPLSVDGQEIVPAGTDITGHIADLRSAGKFQGQSLVVLQLDSINAGGNTYAIQTDQYRKEGSSRGKNTAEKVGAGAVVGAVLGGILGGGKGAAIGGAAGAGAGGGVQAASKAQQIKLPPETVLNFTLQAPVSVIKTPNPDANRPKLGDSQQ
jgi:hypothetical protein